MYIFIVLKSIFLFVLLLLKAQVFFFRTPQVTHARASRHTHLVHAENNLLQVFVRIMKTLKQISQ